MPTATASIHPLRALRKARRLSLRKLGTRATLDYRVVHLIEHRGLRPTPLQKRLLAAALGVSVSELG